MAGARSKRNAERDRIGTEQWKKKFFLCNRTTTRNTNAATAIRHSTPHLKKCTQRVSWTRFSPDANYFKETTTKRKEKKKKKKKKHATTKKKAVVEKRRH
jgi:hypothetical protein